MFLFQVVRDSLGYLPALFIFQNCCLILVFYWWKYWVWRQRTQSPKQIQWMGDREMAQQLIAMASFQTPRGLLPPPICCLAIPYISTFRVSDTFFWLCRHVVLHMVHRHRYKGDTHAWNKTIKLEMKQTQKLMNDLTKCHRGASLVSKKMEQCTGKNVSMAFPRITLFIITIILFAFWVTVVLLFQSNACN